MTQDPRRRSFQLTDDQQVPRWIAWREPRLADLENNAVYRAMMFSRSSKLLLIPFKRSNADLRALASEVPVELQLCRDLLATGLPAEDWLNAAWTSKISALHAWLDEIWLWSFALVVMCFVALGGGMAFFSFFFGLAATIRFRGHPGLPLWIHDLPYSKKEKAALRNFVIYLFAACVSIILATRFEVHHLRNPLPALFSLAIGVGGSFFASWLTVWCLDDLYSSHIRKFERLLQVEGLTD